MNDASREKSARITDVKIYFSRNICFILINNSERAKLIKLRIVRCNYNWIPRLINVLFGHHEIIFFARDRKTCVRLICRNTSIINNEINERAAQPENYNFNTYYCFLFSFYLELFVYILCGVALEFHAKSLIFSLSFSVRQ